MRGLEEKVLSHKIVFKEKDFISYKTIILCDIMIDSLYGGLDIGTMRETIECNVKIEGIE